MLLAEANEPLDKLTEFVGEHGDQMHMLFSFTVNQALYLAFVRGEAVPVADALRELPALPPDAQWAHFIKNHDEASLDKLTDAERAEVFAAFAPKKSMQLFDRGIRRRFPSMVDGDRRRMELAYSLLFSLPGTPVLLYGEEIGLGDDQRMPDREAVRLPMQWSGRPGAGFTDRGRANTPPTTARGRSIRLPGPERRSDSARTPARSSTGWSAQSARARSGRPSAGASTGCSARAARPRSRTSRPGMGQAPSPCTTSAAPRCMSPFACRRTSRKVAGSTSSGLADGEVPAVRHGRLNLELQPYAYHWFGRRDGV